MEFMPPIPSLCIQLSMVKVSQEFKDTKGEFGQQIWRREFRIKSNLRISFSRLHSSRHFGEGFWDTGVWNTWVWRIQNYMGEELFSNSDNWVFNKGGMAMSAMHPLPPYIVTATTSTTTAPPPCHSHDHQNHTIWHYKQTPP